MADENKPGGMVNRIGARLGLNRRGVAAGPNAALVAFHCADGRDHAGRTHADILAFDDATLERVHDFIQWLFPLPEPSGAFPGAPVMGEADLALLHASDVCQQRLAAALDRMTGFLSGSSAWLRPHDHNQLRITRIIRSARLISGDARADGFRGFVLDHIQRRQAFINPTTLAFWAKA